MYRDTAQWSSIRHQILEQGVSIRRVVRDTGISRKTVRKMLGQPCPGSYQSKTRVRPKLEPHTSTIRRLLSENAALPPSERLSVQTIFKYLRDQKGFVGAYCTVQRYARLLGHRPKCAGQTPSNLLRLLTQKEALGLRAPTPASERPLVMGHWTELNPAVTEPGVTKSFELDVRVWAHQAAFEWMHALLQNNISHSTLCRQIGDVPGFENLLKYLYNGRLSDRNRAMVVLADRLGMSKRAISGFLRIDRKTVRKYVRTFNVGGVGALFARQTKSGRKFDDEAIKQAVFGLLHQPPSSHGINRTTWIMADLVRVLKETGQPACSHVIRKITGAAGYRWRKARVVLTSSDANYSEKLAHIQAILAELGPREVFFSIDEFGPFAIKMKPGRYADRSR